MNEKFVRVLFIGENEAGFSFFFRHLEEQGCECKLASSYTVGARLFAEQPFDLVLCSGQPGIRTLLAAVTGSHASVFCAHIVESGCWWFPAIRRGEKCLGAPALRPREFAEVLRRMLDEIRSSAGNQAIAAAR